MLGERGLVHGYPWPLIQVEHMEDTRSQYCIRTAEHENYKQAQRGMSLEQFTQELCIWRPHWEDEGQSAFGPALGGSFAAEPGPIMT
jgi:hypothetical protein